MKLSRDFLGGLLFIFFGVGAILVASAYRFGTPAQMGPGFFPVVLGAAIAVLGVAISARAATAPDPSDAGIQIGLRPLVLVIGAVIVFGIIIQHLGFILSVAILVIVGRLADRERSWTELAIMVPVLTGVAYAVFILLLKMPLQLWP